MSGLAGTNPRDFATEAEFLAFVRANPNAGITCPCEGDADCGDCGGDGTYPAWLHDPEITGYPHERGTR